MNIKERSEENEIIVSELQDTVEYFCGLFEDRGELKGRALESLQNAVERLEIFNAIGSIYQWGLDVLNKCGVKYKGMKENKKSLKESKEFFVGDKTAKGFEVCMIEDGKKYYLSKLAKNVVDSDWSSDHTYAKHWKDESKAEEVVDMLNSELKESKKSARKTMNEKISSKYVYNFKNNGDYMISMFDDYNFEILAIPNDKSLFSKDLPKFKIEKTYIYEQYNDDIWLFVGEVEELGWCFIAFDKYANNSNVYAYQYGDNEKYAYIPFRSYILYLENKKVYRTHNIESKKSARKSLKESAKPINEKNVAKFVDELNKWVDKTINYVDGMEFAIKYGKLYSFDYVVDSDGTIRVYDEEGTLDWWDGGRVVEFIKNRANGYGWYAEACSGDSDFCFAEL